MPVPIQARAKEKTTEEEAANRLRKSRRSYRRSSCSGRRASNMPNSCLDRLSADRGLHYLALDAYLRRFGGSDRAPSIRARLGARDGSRACHRLGVEIE